MNRLRNDAKVSLCYEYLKDNVNAAAKILFFNIRSQHRHFSDLEQNFDLQYSDIIAVAEIRFTDIDNSDTYALSGFHLYRFDYPSCGLQRPVYGLAFYVRKSILNQNLQKKNVWYFTGFLS